MKARTVLAALVALGSTLVQADGFYIGGEVHQAKTADEELCYELTTTSCEDETNGWRLDLGYAFNDYFALEAGYMSSGEFSAIDDYDGPTYTVETSADILDVSVIGQLPLGDLFSLFAKAGLTYSENSFSERYVNGSIDASSSNDDNDSGYIYGVGLSIGWLVVGYDVLSGSEMKFSSGSSSDYDFKRLYAGVKFGF